MPRVGQLTNRESIEAIATLAKLIDQGSRVFVDRYGAVYVDATRLERAERLLIEKAVQRRMKAALCAALPIECFAIAAKDDLELVWRAVDDDGRREMASLFAEAARRAGVFSILEPSNRKFLALWAGRDRD